jgi:hypothetical protein
MFYLPKPTVWDWSIGEMIADEVEAINVVLMEINELSPPKNTQKYTPQVMQIELLDVPF